MVTNFSNLSAQRSGIGKKAYSCLSLSLSLLFLLVPLSSNAIPLPVHTIIETEDAVVQDASRSKVDCCILKTVTAIEKKLACNSAIAFGSAEINRPGGFVITKPGLYCLKEDVVFSPRVSQFAPPDPRAVQAAITIQSSDVFLDLGAHTLSQAGSGTSTQVPFVVGILIPDMAPNNPDLNFPALQSIYIKGDDPAIIDGFSMFGIRIFAHTADIRLTNITVKNCAQLASKALRANPSYAPHDGALPADYCPLINNMQLGPGFGVGGISIGESSTLAMGTNFFVDSPNYQLYNRVNGLILENVSSVNNFFNNITAINITDLTFNNCHFDHPYSDDPGSNAGLPNELGPVPAIGAIFFENFGVTFTSSLSVINGSIRNTTFNNSKMQGDLTTGINGNFNSLAASFPVYGAYDIRSQDMNYYNCQFNNSYLGFPGIGNCNCGGYLSASPIDGTFENCSFDGHTAVSAIQAFHRSGECFGVRSSRNTHLINCTANNLTNIGDQQLPAPVVGNNSIIGFIFLYAKDVTLDGCISQDLIKNGPSGATRSRGIEIQSSSGDPAAAVNNIVVRNCVVSRVFSFNGGISAGFVLRNQFATDATKSTVFENCISTGNQTFAPTLTTAGIVQGPAWGFFVQLLPTASPEAFSAIPTSFEGCKALHNKGVPVLVGATNQYTAGFYVNNALEVSFHNCEVVDNIYGFLLQRSGNCTIRNCRADSNFVAGTLSTEAIAVGGTGYTVGDILTLTGGSNNAQVRVTTIGAGGVVTGITLVNVGSGYTTGIVPTTGGTGTGATVNITAIATIGEGFTDVGPTPGTPAAPGLSTSTFERNQSFKNGAGNIHDGTNGNYNILYNAAGPVHEALLAGSLSVINSFAPTPSQPTYYAILHNLSVIQ